MIKFSLTLRFKTEKNKTFILQKSFLYMTPSVWKPIVLNYLKPVYSFLACKNYHKYNFYLRFKKDEHGIRLLWIVIWAKHRLDNVFRFIKNIVYFLLHPVTKTLINNSYFTVVIICFVYFLGYSTLR